MKERPIGVFDSGVGGLTVLEALMKTLPREHLIYLGDDARGPYGPRDMEEVRRFALQIIEYLLGFGVKIVVAACNSATAAALETAQDAFDVPVVGVVEPGARAAVRSTKKGKIGVIGTRCTMNSGTYELAISSMNPSVTVYSQACPEFVEYVERGEVEGRRIKNIAKMYLDPMVESGIDALIMGCTHYPLLADLLGKVVGPGVSLISSAGETAQEVRDILARLGWQREGETPPTRHFLTTGDPERCRELGLRFLGPAVEGVVRVNLGQRPDLRGAVSR